MDSLRYGSETHKRPVVVWNMTRRCNLKCIHCYSNSRDIPYKNELTTDEGKKLISDLAYFRSPVILFSGGEPLMRGDLPELVEFAVDRGMRAVISTNGTLLTREIVTLLKKTGISYVGVSLDGMEKTHDRFRGVEGAFDMTIKGIRTCLEEGIKVGVRLTMNRKNFSDIPAIFNLIEKENIPRACFYHLVYSGRGSKLIEEDLSHGESRQVIDCIMERTREIGVLRAIGATPKIIYNLFVAEGMIVSVFSIFLGLLLSWPLSIVASKFFGNLMLEVALRFSFSKIGFVITLTTTLIFGWIASRIPAQKAVSVSTREALAYE